jgi:hypothetical protein
MQNARLREINWQCCPEKFRGGLKRYLENAIMPGHFLGAVLENDLIDAFRRADNESWQLMSELLKFLENEIPAHSWGSPERVRAYIAWIQTQLARIDK